MDLTLTLIPAIAWLKASCMLTASGLPAEAAVRVLALPGERRQEGRSVDLRAPQR